jgi:hypothetical protein
VTGTGACGDIRHALGVYVLSAIEPADRAAVATHLACCPDCREEHAGLADLPAFLDRVLASDASRLVLEDGGSGSRRPRPPHPAARSPLHRTAKHRRHPLRPRLAAAVAAGLIIGAGTVTAWYVLVPSAPQAAVPALQWAATVRASNPQTHASATVEYAAQPWGLTLHVQVSGIPAGTTCQFQITNSRGQEVAAASWTVPGGQQDPWYPVTSSVPLTSVHGFVVTAATKTLVSIPIR